MKKILSVVLVVALVFAMTASIAEAKDVKDLKLGFILGSREHAFYLKIEEGINAAAADLGFKAIVDESDLQGAIATERIEGMVVEGLDAISLACNEPAACTIAIEQADAQGVPMFTFDCTSGETDVIKCFVGTDNYQGGVVGGEATIAWLDKLGLKEGATVGTQPRDSSSSFVTSRCTLASSLDASQRLMMISDCAASSKVERNASTRWCGRRRTSPTVSMSMTLTPPGSFRAREVGSRVANSLS